MKQKSWLFAPALLLFCFLFFSCSSAPENTPAATPPPLSITVGTDPQFEPFSVLNKKNQQIEGLEIDLINAIAQKQNLQVKYINKPYDTLLAGMSQGLYDAAVSSIIITPELQKEMLFSDPYFAAGQIVVVLKSNTSILGKDTLSGPTGAQKGARGAAEIENLKAAKLVAYDKIDAAFQDLLSGKVNAVVCENSIASVIVGKYPENFKTVGGVFTEESYGIAVMKDKTDLLARINSGLQAARSEGLLEQLAQKWFSQPDTPAEEALPPTNLPQ